MSHVYELWDRTNRYRWYFFPGFIWTSLSTFNWISWIAPNNTTLNNLVGSNNGLGINPWVSQFS